MDNPTLSKSVADAASIKESGRWGALNQRIVEMVARPGVGNEWYVQLFGQLSYQALLEYSSLRQAYEKKENGDAALLAWRARNLLELSVWATYFAASRDNARRLYEDAGRDVHDLLTAFEAWGQKNAQSADWLSTFASGKQDLAERAAREGVVALETRYLRVEAAAADCGLEAPYRVLSKTLSKFVHPTALHILGVADEAKTIMLRDFFFSLGCTFFVGAFSALENLNRSENSTTRE